MQEKYVRKNGRVYLVIDGRMEMPIEERMIRSGIEIVNEDGASTRKNVKKRNTKVVENIAVEDTREVAVSQPNVVTEPAAVNKTITGITSLSSAPKTISLNQIIDPASVVLNAKYSDNTTTQVKATLIICNSASVGNSTAYAYYNGFGPITFNVVVIA